MMCGYCLDHMALFHLQVPKIGATNCSIGSMHPDVNVLFSSLDVAMPRKSCDPRLSEGEDCCLDLATDT